METKIEETKRNEEKQGQGETSTPKDESPATSEKSAASACCSGKK